MIQVFDGRTADEVWRKAKTALDGDDCGVEQPSRVGPTREILHAAFSIREPRQRWIIARSPAINPAFALAEVVWIITGRNDSEFVNYFNPKLPNFSGTGSTYHGAYGYRLRKQFGVDQLDRAFHVLAANPHSRQVTLQLWDARVDLPDEQGREVAADIPCNVLSMLKVRGNALEWTQIMRSNDLYRGLPHNIVQFTTLQEVVAGWLGLEVGSYNHVSDSLHVYQNSEDFGAERSEVELQDNTDSLAYCKAVSDTAFAGLAQHVEMILDPGTSVIQLIDIVEMSCLLPAFKNILCVLCAEGARRRQEADAAMQLMAYCSNPIYRQLFARWSARF